MHDDEDNDGTHQQNGESQKDNNWRIGDGEGRMGQVEDEEGDGKESGKPANLPVNGHGANDNPFHREGERHGQAQEDEDGEDEIVKHAPNFAVDGLGGPE